MRKVVISGMLGNGLEWYDYALYGQMAYILSTLFFPGDDPYIKLLATFGVFAVGFIVRPLGAVVFGYIGDKYGRRTSLVLAILMMAIPTGCIGLLPTYAQIGYWAPFFLTVIRVLQGLSLGGEFSGSITYIVEHAPQNKRGLAGSASIASLIIGFMCGTFVALLISHLLSPEDFASYGWRIPFLFGIVIGLVGLYIRSSCEESPMYETARRENTLSKTPVREAIVSHPKEMAQAFMIYMTVTMPFYLLSIYLISFMQNELKLPISDALLINTIAMFWMMVTTLISAYACDLIGRKRIMQVAAVLMFMIAIPVFQWMDSATFAAVLAAQLLLGTVMGMYMGPVPAVLVELFPTSVRYSGMALSYNLAAALVGGTTPMVCVWLLKQTDMHLSIAWYVMACNIFSLIALYFYHDKFKEPLQ